MPCAVNSMEILAKSWAGPQVLIVEDDPVAAKIAKRMFAKVGIETDHASNGIEALELLSQRRHRMIFSDWMMPEMTGIQLCVQIRELAGPYTYFIICSSKGDRADRLAAFEAGVDDMLDKPLDSEVFLSRLKVAARLLEIEDRLQQQNDILEENSVKQSEMNEHLKFASYRFMELFNGLPVACFTFDELGQVHEWNRGAEEAFGIQSHFAFLQPLHRLLGEEQGEVWTDEQIARVFMREDSHVFDWTFTSRSGVQKDFACKIICLRRIDGTTAGAVCANLDITERKQAEKRIADQMRMIEQQKSMLEAMNSQLEHLAITDGLTGLSNHRRFQELLEEATSHHSRAGQPFSVLLLDIDHFKKFNDDFGHQVGDEVLKTVANVLKQTARDFENPARYGGEEFALILWNCRKEQALKVAERFITAIRDIQRLDRKITASFGVATSEDGTLSGRVMINRADEALYASKRAGRDCVTHFDDMERNELASAA